MRQTSYRFAAVRVHPVYRRTAFQDPFGGLPPTRRVDSTGQPSGLGTHRSLRVPTRDQVIRIRRGPPRKPVFGGSCRRPRTDNDNVHDGRFLRVDSTNCVIRYERGKPSAIRVQQSLATLGNGGNTLYWTVFIFVFLLLLLSLSFVCPQAGMEFKTRVKNESNMEAWETSEAYDVSDRCPNKYIDYTQCTTPKKKRV